MEWIVCEAGHQALQTLFHELPQQRPRVAAAQFPAPVRPIELCSKLSAYCGRLEPAESPRQRDEPTMKSSVKCRQPSSSIAPCSSAAWILATSSQSALCTHRLILHRAHRTSFPDGLQLAEFQRKSARFRSCCSSRYRWWVGRAFWRIEAMLRAANPIRWLLMHERGEKRVWKRVIWKSRHTVRSNWIQIHFFPSILSENLFTFVDVERSHECWNLITLRVQ